MSSQRNERHGAFGAILPRVRRRFGNSGDGRTRGKHGNGEGKQQQDSAHGDSFHAVWFPSS